MVFTEVEFHRKWICALTGGETRRGRITRHKIQAGLETKFVKTRFLILGFWKSRAMSRLLRQLRNVARMLPLFRACRQHGWIWVVIGCGSRTVLLIRRNYIWMNSVIRKLPASRPMASLTKRLGTISTKVLLNL